MILPQPNEIVLRFVYCGDATSRAILLDTGGRYSHVEAVTPEGKYLGAHADGGVQALDPGYDAATLVRELFVTLTVEPVMAMAFYHYLDAVVGEPYDFGAIAGFVAHMDLHEKHRVICSALQALGLGPGCRWFPAPLSQPAHEISPAMLLLILSGRVVIIDPNP